MDNLKDIINVLCKLNIIYRRAYLPEWVECTSEMPWACSDEEDCLVLSSISNGR